MGVREVTNRFGVLVAAALLLGALAALVWARVTVLPSFVVGAEGQATITERGMASVASADWWFSVLGLVRGLILGLGAWLTLRRIGWPVALVAVIVSLASGVTCWLLGEALGPGPFAARIAEATAGEVVPVALELHAVSALAVWPLAAVGVPLFASALGPEVEGERRARRERRRREQAGDRQPVGTDAP